MYLYLETDLNILLWTEIELAYSLLSLLSKFIVGISGKVMHKLPQENTYAPHHNKLKKVDPALLNIF